LGCCLLPSTREAVGSRRAKLALRGRGWGVVRHILKQRFLRRHPPPQPLPATRKGAWEEGSALCMTSRSRFNTVIASASEAIHGAAKQVWIASSHPPSPEGGLRRTRVLLGKTRLRDLAGACAPSFALTSRPLRIEGAGNAGRPMRPIAACAIVENKSHALAGHTGITRHSPRNGFNEYSVLSPVLRACWPPSPALLIADLTPASGCQDHTSSHVR
jgi:hypothetical protein